MAARDKLKAIQTSFTCLFSSENIITAPTLLLREYILPDMVGIFNSMTKCKGPFQNMPAASVTLQQTVSQQTNGVQSGVLAAKGQEIETRYSTTAGWRK